MFLGSFVVGMNLVIIIVFELFALLLGSEGLGFVIMGSGHLTEKGIWNWNKKKGLRVLNLIGSCVLV